MFVHLDLTNTLHNSQGCVKNPKQFTSLENVTAYIVEIYNVQD